jgi:hypothetical protein
MLLGKGRSLGFMKHFKEPGKVAQVEAEVSEQLSQQREKQRGKTVRRKANLLSLLDTKQVLLPAAPTFPRCWNKSDWPHSERELQQACCNLLRPKPPWD